MTNEEAVVRGQPGGGLPGSGLGADHSAEDSFDLKPGGSHSPLAASTFMDALSAASQRCCMEINVSRSHPVWC